MIAELYQLTRGRVPLIGVGGIFTAEDAWEKIAAGASLVQLYTGFIYQGPNIVREINEGLASNSRRVKAFPVWPRPSVAAPRKLLMRKETK